ncbi:hypothetical protein [Bradyrhizobium embrapense]
MNGSRDGRIRETLANRNKAADRIELDAEQGTARVDTHLLTWHQVDGGACYRRHKTGVLVDMAVSEDLQKALAATQRKHVTVINTEYGKPCTVDGFSRFMRDTISAAGLPLDCKPHGLRKTLADSSLMPNVARMTS